MEYIPYKKETLDILAEDYYASSFVGEMGSEEYSQAFRSWLNDQTDGILKEQIEGLGFEADAVMALATTVCFNARWMEEFREENTKPATFHAEEGDMQRDFMNNLGAGFYYYGDHFGAILKFFDAGTANMAVIMPDKGVSVYDLLNDEQVLDLIEEGVQYKNIKSAIINLSIPKFDVSSDRDLIEELRELGITDAFEKATANFSPITDEVENIWISKVQHGVRVPGDVAAGQAHARRRRTVDIAADIHFHAALGRAVHVPFDRHAELRPERAADAVQMDVEEPGGIAAEGRDDFAVLHHAEFVFPLFAAEVERRLRFGQGPAVPADMASGEVRVRQFVHDGLFRLKSHFLKFRLRGLDLRHFPLELLLEDLCVPRGFPGCPFRFRAGCLPDFFCFRTGFSGIFFCLAAHRFGLFPELAGPARYLAAQIDAELFRVLCESGRLFLQLLRIQSGGLNAESGAGRLPDP